MGKSKKSKTEVIETELSKEQVKILKSREAFYQSFTLPSLQDYYNATQNFELRDDFATLDDLTTQLDGIFTSDPEQSQLSRELFRRGFSGEDIASAELSQRASGAVGREQTFSAARLAAIQQSNQNVLARNQNQLQEQNVRSSGVGALLSQAPSPTGAGASPIITQSTPQGNAWMGALGGALGAGGSALFSGGSGGGNQQIFDPQKTFGPQSSNTSFFNAQPTGGF